LRIENVVCILIVCFVMFLIIREKIQHDNKQRKKFWFLRGIVRSKEKSILN